MSTIIKSLKISIHYFRGEISKETEIELDVPVVLSQLLGDGL